MEVDGRVFGEGVDRTARCGASQRPARVMVMSRRQRSRENVADVVVGVYEWPA